MCSPGVWKMNAGSNLYLLEHKNNKILIDTGSRANRDDLTTWLARVCPLEEITHVIFTHLHHDHAGNFDLFRNAKLYASPDEIASLKQDSKAATLDETFGHQIMNADFESTQSFNVRGIEIINTPGHTKGSICVWVPERKILFTGDTLFNHTHGRTDLPTSSKEKMMEALIELVPYNFKFLCPGHDCQENLPLPH